MSAREAVEALFPPEVLRDLTLIELRRRPRCWHPEERRAACGVVDDAAVAPGEGTSHAS